MKNGKYTKRKGVATKTLVLALAIMLIVGCSIGGTLAWLTAETDSVVNTFTVGDINIDLTETWNAKSQGSNENDIWTGKLVPGTNLTKDPTVTVKADSEACWLFVKVEEANWPTYTYKDEDENTLRKVDYEIADGWTQLVDKDSKEVPGVFYREVGAATTDTSFKVLKNDVVTVSATLLKTELEAIGNNPNGTPKLTITAYAVQKDNVATAADAWAIATAP